MEASEAAKNALECVLGAKKGESVAIFCDDEKTQIGEAFLKGALKLGLQTRFVKLSTKTNVFRTEIPEQLLKVITNSPPNIYINLMRGVRQETVFRIELTKLETKERKARLGHCPGVTLDMLTEGALALTTHEHKQMQEFANRLIDKLAGTQKIQITNPAGTNLELSVDGRSFFTDTIIDWKTLKWMNLPTGETLVGPVENSLEGTLVCDMAIGGIGPIKTPVKLSVEKGLVMASASEDVELLKQVNDSLETDSYSNMVGEFAFGINPKARFVNEFLEAEKMLRTVHIAFGNNSDYPGGMNRSKNHMDLLLSASNVRAFNKNGSVFDILTKGQFQNF
jgi:leucyl aminopeptidase (aminopeptidase T)